MNYQIIKNADVLKNFIAWLPELLPGNSYYLALLARNKYVRHLNLNIGDKICLSRKVATKEYLFRKLKQLEVPIGAYIHDDIEIPEESLACYISINPRSHVLAAKNMLKNLADCVTSEYSGYNINALSLNHIQKSCGQRVYADMDFDLPEAEIFSTIAEIEKFINPDCMTYIRTRGGFHALMKFEKMDKKYEKTWYNSFKALKGCDVTDTSHALLPIPGCVQGGGDFFPYFL